MMHEIFHKSLRVDIFKIKQIKTKKRILFFKVTLFRNCNISAILCCHFQAKLSKKANKINFTVIQKHQENFLTRNNNKKLQYLQN